MDAVLELAACEERLLRLLELVAEETRDCKACGAKLWFVRHRNGARAPYTANGENHFITCPKADLFRRKAKASGE